MFVLIFADLCKDTSDTESYSSDDDLDTMAFVEYELAPSSGSDTELDGFSSSSSGAEVSYFQYFKYIFVLQNTNTLILIHLN